MNLSPRNEEQSLLIVDSFALLFRGFFSMAVMGNYMRNTQGLCTNGIYQFTRYMLDAIKTFNPTHVVCTFDMGKETFRNEMYPLYKANRDSPPEELIPQFDKLWELVDAFDIPCVGKVGYEADDMIGSMAKHYSAEGVKVNILTGDGDTLQLINENTEVTLMKKGFGNYETVNLSNLQEVKGIEHPYQIIEMKALMGDAADNIPGCPGVGPKTAVKLINEYGNVERLYENIGEIKGKLKERLVENKEQVYLSRDLATIHTDIEFDCPLDTCIYKWDRQKLLAKLEEFEFKNLIRAFAG
jgi:5'-3' exonuclease